MHNDCLATFLKYPVKKNHYSYNFLWDFQFPVLAAGKAGKTILDLIPGKKRVFNPGNWRIRQSGRISKLTPPTMKALNLNNPGAHKTVATPYRIGKK